MDGFILLLSGLILILLHYLLKRGEAHDRKIVPGPTIIQILIDAIKSKGNIALILLKWGQDYGPIFQLGVGPIKYFVLNEVNLIKEAFGGPHVAGRIPIPILDPFLQGRNALIHDGVEAFEIRSFALSTLKKFGSGRTSMTNLIEEEMSQFLTSLEKQEGQLISIRKRFLVSSMNALWIVLANRRFDLEKDSQIIKTFFDFLENVEKMSLNPASVHPTLFHKFSWLPGWKKHLKLYTTVNQYFTHWIEEHEKTFVENNPRDLIDTYLDKYGGRMGIEIEGGNWDSKFDFDPDKKLKAIMFDFLIAGSDTSSLTFEWCVLTLALNPQIQIKLRDQIHKIVGMDKLPSAADRPKLPSVEAFIWELFRLYSPPIIGIPHRVTEETQIGGYILPKDSIVVSNLHWIHRDPNVWPQVDTFWSERFLTADGNLDRKGLEGLIPFSFGRRRCIGQDLAMDTIFLFLCGILQNFRIDPHPSHPLTLDSKGGILLAPIDFSVILTKI